MIQRGSRRQEGLLATISECALGALLPLRNKGTSSHLRDRSAAFYAFQSMRTQSSDMNRAESSASGGRPRPTIVSPAASRAASAKFIASKDSSMRRYGRSESTWPLGATAIQGMSRRMFGRKNPSDLSTSIGGPDSLVPGAALLNVWSRPLPSVARGLIRRMNTR